MVGFKLEIVDSDAIQASKRFNTWIVGSRNNVENCWSSDWPTALRHLNNLFEAGKELLSAARTIWSAALKMFILVQGFLDRVTESTRICEEIRYIHGDNRSQVVVLEWLEQENT